MTHPRRIIRESVTERLKYGNTSAADRVWASREPPVDVESMLIGQGPIILIYTRADRTAQHNGNSPMGFGWQKRECDLIIEIVAAGALVVDGILDDIAEQVEEIVDAFSVPGMPATEIRHIETTIESTLEFEQPVGGAMVHYEACYWRPWREDPDEMDDFFPKVVSSRPNETTPYVVADCEECEQCPPGGQP